MRRDSDEIDDSDAERLFSLDEIMNDPEAHEGREERTITKQERSELLREVHDSMESKNLRVNLWKPTIRGVPVHSVEQALRILKDEMPGISKHEMFDDIKSRIIMHSKTYQEFGPKKKTTYAEIREFSEQNSYPSTTIEGWVTHGIQPRGYCIINENALTKHDAKKLISNIRQNLGDIQTKEQLDLLLNTTHHELHTKTLPHFPKDYRNACVFYRFLDELEEGGVVSDIAKRTGIKRLTARTYTEELAIPRLVHKVLRRRLEPSESIHAGEVVQDETHYEQLLRRNPHIRHMDDFDSMDRHMRAYMTIRHLQMSGRLPKTTQEDLAAQLGIRSARVNEYLSGKSAPRLQSILLVHEKARRAYEEQLSQSATKHRIAPESVYWELQQHRDTGNLRVDDIASSLAVVYEQSPIVSKVQWLDLHGYAPTGQDWFSNVVGFISKNLAAIESSLNDHLAIEGPDQRLRLGVVESRVYLRLENTQENDWMQLYKNEMFHFHKTERFERVLSKAKENLSIKGDISLSRLVHQVSDYNRSLTRRGMNTDLHPNASYVKGATLSLLLDSCDMTIQEIEADISSIGRIDRRLIRNPRFSDNPLEIDKAFARVFGAGLSDGHIDQFGVFCYGEADIGRVNIVKKHVEFFGDVDYTEDVDKNGFHDIRYSSVLGRMLQSRGFSVGDKTVQNRGIPEFIMNGPIAVQVEYLKQLWPEDGHFITGEKYLDRFGWTRAVSLRDPEKDVKYTAESNITDDMIRAIKEVGTYREDTGFPDIETYPRYVLSGPALERSLNHPDAATRKALSELRSTIEANKPKLLSDEKKLLENLGIGIQSECDYLTLYLGTGRVSVLFRAWTQSLDDTMKVAIVASPDDVRKSTSVCDWIQSQKVRYRRVRQELESEDLIPSTN
jgi:transcriptional regulator with XRE-family HTH domain